MIARITDSAESPANGRPRILRLPRQCDVPPNPDIVRRPFAVNILFSRRLDEQKKPVERWGNNDFERGLKDTHIDAKDVFFGVAGFKALDLLAIAGKNSDEGKGTEYQNAVLYDVNVREIKLMDMILSLIAQSPTPEDFIRNFTARKETGVRRNPSYYTEYIHPPRPGSMADEEAQTYRQHPEERQDFYSVPGSGYQPQNAEQLKTWMERWSASKGPDDESWLRPDNYESIRRMVQAHKIQTAYIDLEDAKSMSTLNQSLQDQGFRARHVYISSLLEFSANPNLRTDYFGRTTGDPQKRAPYDPNSRLNAARQFCDNLIGFGNTRAYPARFIISEPSDQQIYQSYHLRMVGHDHIRKHKDALPEKVPDYKDMDYQYFFSVGDQAWRLMSFYAEDKEGNPILNAQGEKQRYFRIVSENYRFYPYTLMRQMDNINETIDKVCKGDSIVVCPLPEGANMSTHEQTFAHEAGRYDKWKQTAENERKDNPHIVFASRPFTWGAKATEHTMEDVVNTVKQAMTAALEKGLRRNDEARFLRKSRLGSYSEHLSEERETRTDPDPTLERGA